MIINDLDDYYIVFDTKNRNTELDTLVSNHHRVSAIFHSSLFTKEENVSGLPLTGG